MSRRFFCPSFDPATSSCLITSAATGAKQCASSFVPSAPTLLPAKILTRSEPDRTALCPAQLKHLLRKAAARTVDTVGAAIGEVLTAFTPEECANYLEN